jgi:hypothetical protein
MVPKGAKSGDLIAAKDDLGNNVRVRVPVGAVNGVFECLCVSLCMCMCARGVRIQRDTFASASGAQRVCVCVCVCV